MFTPPVPLSAAPRPRAAAPSHSQEPVPGESRRVQRHDERDLRRARRPFKPLQDAVADSAHLTAVVPDTFPEEDLVFVSIDPSGGTEDEERHALGLVLHEAAVGMCYRQATNDLVVVGCLDLPTRNPEDAYVRVARIVTALYVRTKKPVPVLVEDNYAHATSPVCDRSPTSTTSCARTATTSACTPRSE